MYYNYLTTKLLYLIFLKKNYSSVKVGLATKKKKKKKKKKRSLLSPKLVMYQPRVRVRVSAECPPTTTAMSAATLLTAEASSNGCSCNKCILTQGAWSCFFYIFHWAASHKPSQLGRSSSKSTHQKIWQEKTNISSSRVKRVNSVHT